MTGFLKRYPMASLLCGALVVLGMVCVLRMGVAGRGAGEVGSEDAPATTFAGNDDADGDGSASDAQGEAGAQGDADARDDADAGGDADARADGADAGEEGLTERTTAGEIALTYVDTKGGVYEFPSALTLNRGATVRVRESAGLYQLADGYLAELWTDVTSWQGGVREFSTELSRMVDTDQYVAFLGELAEWDEAARARVTHLAVDAGAFEAEAGSARVEPEPEVPAEPERDPGQAEELYGNKPSAGAME